MGERHGQAKGLADSAIRAAIHAENVEKCAPALDTAEVDAIVDNVLARYPKAVAAATPGSKAANNTVPPANGLTQVQTLAPASTGGVPVITMLPGAPVDPLAEVPASIVLSTGQGIEVHRADAKGVMHLRRVFPSPVLVVERLKDVHTGQEHLRVAWYGDASWQFSIVERRTIASNVEILSLANFGVPVNSDNKAFLA